MVKRKLKCGSWLILGLAGVMILSFMTACAAKKGSEDLEAVKTQAQVASVRVEAGEELDKVIIATEPESVGYSVYKWKDPVRVVVDIADAVSDQVPSIIPVADGLIQEVEVKKLEGEGASANSMVRVIINLDKSSEYEVNREQGNLVVSLAKADAGLGESDLFPGAKGMVLIQHGDSLSPVSTSSQDWAWGGPSEQPASSAASGNSAKNLVNITVAGEQDLTRVNLVTDGSVGDYSAFTLENPDRLVIDLWGLNDSAKMARKAVNDQGVLRVRTGQHDDKVRLVFDAVDNLPHFRFDKSGNNLVVTFSRTMDVSATSEVSVAAATETAGAAADPVAAPADNAMDWPVMDVAQAEWSGPQGSSTASDWSVPASVPSSSGAPLDWGPSVTVPDKGKDKVGIAYIDSVKFDYSNDASTIVIHADRPIRREMWTREDNPEEKIISFFISNSQVSADQQRSYDTTEFMSPVEFFSVFQRPNQPNEVAVVIVMRTWAASKWSQTDNRLKIQFENYAGSLGLGGGPSEGMFGPRGEEMTGGVGIGPGTMAPPGGMIGSAAAGEAYTGPPISLDFKNMDILDALRTIAEVSGMNIIIDDSVKGRLTIKLDNVPWDQALDLILDTKGLGKVEKGNIIRVAPKSVLSREKAEKMAELEAAQKYEQLTMAIIPVNYLKSSDMLKLIKPRLTPGRGKANADKRTNSVIIYDIPSAIEEARTLISTLDRPTAQVLIEARIVEATVGVTRQIGVTWGTNVDIGPGTGTPTGVDFPSTVQVGGATLGGFTTGNASTAATALSDGGGALGLTLGSLTNSIDLDVALRALEAQEKIKIISSPRVLTLTDERATIEQGVSIPYPPPSIVSGAGVGWTFVNAALELQVTPHVAADKSIIMEIKASNNEPVTVAGSDRPGISKKEANTTILLRNGETAVIGGIFKIRKSTPVTQVPFLGNLPIIGPLFRNKIDESRNEELIIFLTPQIVEPGQGLGEQMLSAGM